jgi:hypothetical protein
MGMSGIPEVLDNLGHTVGGQRCQQRECQAMRENGAAVRDPGAESRNCCRLDVGTFRNPMRRLHLAEIEHAAAPTSFLFWVVGLFPFGHRTIRDAEIVHRHHQPQDDGPELFVFE